MDSRFHPGKDGWSLLSYRTSVTKYRKSTTVRIGNPQHDKKLVWTLRHDSEHNLYILDCQYDPGNVYSVYMGPIKTKAFWHQIWKNVQENYK